MQTIHVFIACFPSLESALAYSQPQWEPEPAAEASDEEYEAWEDRNPSWLMKNDLGITYLDEDFIETIWGTNGDGRSSDWKYLSSFIGNESAAVCKKIAAIDDNTLILIDAQASGGFPVAFRSTSAMTYCGPFPSQH